MISTEEAEARQSPAAQMMDSLVNEYNTQMAQVEPYMNGQVASQGAQTAAQIGQSIAGSAVQAPSAAISGMLSKDANNWTNADVAGGKAVAGAVQNLGNDLGVYTASAPYADILQALQSEAQYKQETAGSAGSTGGIALPKGSPQFLYNAYQALNTEGSGAGTTSVPSSAGAATAAATTPSSSTSTVAGGGNG